MFGTKNKTKTFGLFVKNELSEEWEFHSEIKASNKIKAQKRIPYWVKREYSFTEIREQDE